MPRLFVASLLFLALMLPASAQEKTILKTTGWGSLSGRVTLDGDIPAVESLVPAIMALNNPVDRACCNAGPAKQKVKPNWVVDAKTKGIANVAVWIKPPDGAVFPIHPLDKKRKDPVTIDQPFCAFVPHMVALYPTYHDGKEFVSTGQKFIVQNTSIVTHNVRSTTQLKYNEAFNVNMISKTEREFALKPQPFPITLECDLHRFMNAYVCVFDHPYFAITQEDGTFTIPRVPAGAEVTLFAWHEVVVLNALAIEGRKMTFKEGKNEFKFSIKK
ncbi:MAG: hypothetical protein HYR84_03205 [Planctomycetes bacterium]|nr:hypothetical protein [Planctomycetota bacterium]